MSAEVGGRVVGEYVVGRQIGSGSYSVVWHGRHRVRGTEVAIKEIAVAKLGSKLRDSLLSEIVILKRIDHPNIIRLHDIIETPGKIHIVLEYCKGGDLSVYIKRHGVVAEPTAKYFMQQLAAGLQVLRENHLIHRDLKPQNLLLSSCDDHPVLKIADFGFARSLQPCGLAETLCGSPLYMAPEIMQLQKYDAKADLWSVGAILYQLVTGKTPFTGNNQVQLLQNIMKSSELQFPPSKCDLSFECLDLCQKLLRRNPVERLTFVEFFGHSFVSPFALNESFREKGESCGRSSVACDQINRTNENSHGVCLPFDLDDNHRATGVKSFSASGSSAPNQHTNASNCMDMTFQDPDVQKGVKTISRQNFSVSAKVNHGSIDNSVDSRQMKFSKGIDSFEWIIRDYVFVSVPPVKEMASSVNASCHSVFKSGSSPRTSAIGSKLSAPVPINASALRASECGGLGSNCSAPSGVSHGSTNQGEVLGQSSSYYMPRIQLLLQCVSIIRELVAKKIESGEQLQAFAIQLVVLAIWKQTLHVCHSDAASAAEESASMDIHSSRGTTNISGRKKHLDCRNSHGSNKEFRESAIDCSRIEREFLLEVGRAEELAGGLGLSNGNTEMPDAVEIIFRLALELGRRGAADEWVGEKDSAVACYEKAVQLLSFLLVEAPLILNPPLSLTASDRLRLRSYIDILSNRHKYSSSQRTTFLNEDQQS